MKYQGSKRRIAKHIIEIMMKYVNGEDTNFYDVFCGGANLVDKVPLKNRIAVDKDEYLIEALKVIRDTPDILPKNNNEFTEQDYKEIQRNKDKYPKWLVGYVGYALSWGGKWFGGFRRDRTGKRDYVNEAYRDALKQSTALKGVEFICADYREVEYDMNSLIYCDPPYENTTKYKIKFNHNEFWDWARTMSYKGYIIFVSEYNAPDDFVCIWQQDLDVGLSHLNGKRENKRRKERLFIHSNLLKS